MANPFICKIFYPAILTAVMNFGLHHTLLAQTKSTRAMNEAAGDKYSIDFTPETNEAVNISQYYQLMLPRQFPKGAPSPVSNFYYPVNKTNFPKYEALKSIYEHRLAELEMAENAEWADSAFYYLHDLVLIREVLYGNRNINAQKYDDTTFAYIDRERRLARKLKLSRAELNAITRQESMLVGKGDVRKAIPLALDRIYLYENGLKTNCSNCNIIPKAYITVAEYYERIGDSNNALLYYRKATEHSKSPIEKEFALQELAGYYINVKQPVKAIETLEAIEKDSAIRFLAFITFKQKAVALIGLKKFQEALDYTNLALEAERNYSKKKNKKFSVSSYDSLFAHIYIGLNQPYNALRYSNKEEVIEKIRTNAEQEKALQDQKLVAAGEKLELEKIRFELENKQLSVQAQKQQLIGALEKSRLKSEADKERLSQLSNIALLNQRLEQQKRTRLILVSGLSLLAMLILFLVRNNSQKKRAFSLLNHRTEQLGEQKEKLQATLENLETAQAKLIQSEKLASLGELTAGIAHEIQNPLNFVNNFAEVNLELLEELKAEIKAGDKAEMHSLVENIIVNDEKIAFHGKRADSIVKGMLQHSRLSTGIKEPMDINSVIDEYFRLSYHGLRAKDKTFNAEMHTDYDPTAGRIDAIQQDLGRVFLNLFTNAFYSVGQKKKILAFKQPGKKPAFEPAVYVKTKRKGNTVRVVIRDNGMGIANKIRGKVFQPFFTTKPTGEGTGLGLSMSFEIITKGHGGEMSMNSQEGEFAEFIISLPLQTKP
jgi:signal transduction histidine kinase